MTGNSQPITRRRQEPRALSSKKGSATVVKSRSRGKILVAARALFGSSGYELTSMADVARGAGVSRATIYNNFGDKVSLLAAIVEDYLAGYIEITTRLRSDIPPEQTVFDHLELMIKEGIVWRLRHADLFPVIDLAKHVPGSRWYEFNAESDRAWLDWTMAIHRVNARAGLLRANLNLEFAAKAIFSMVETTLITFDTPASSRRIDDVARQFALLQWYALYSIEPDEAPLMRNVIKRISASKRG